LPEEQRSVLFLVSVEDLTHRAVAQVVDVPLGTVMSHLARGRERLQQIMGSGAPSAIGRFGEQGIIGWLSHF
jgi:RNA polymerase sigma-70 factor (ECF subfamily)